MQPGDAGVALHAAVQRPLEFRAPQGMTLGGGEDQGIRLGTDVLGQVVSF